MEITKRLPLERAGNLDKAVQTYKRKRSLRNSRRFEGYFAIFLISNLALLCVVVVLVLYWRHNAPTLNLEQLSSELHRQVCCQQEAVNSLLQLLRSSRCCGPLLVAAVGPSGTGKTLLSSVLASVSVSHSGRTVPSQRLIGSRDIVDDLTSLDTLGTNLLTSVSADTWFLLLIEEVNDLLPSTKYLLDRISLACENAGVRFLAVICVTVGDDHWNTLSPSSHTPDHVQRLVDVFPHVSVLKFEPMGRQEVRQCLEFYLRNSGTKTSADTLDKVLAEIMYHDNMAVNGCKNAISKIMRSIHSNSSIQH